MSNWKKYRVSDNGDVTRYGSENWMCSDRDMATLDIYRDGSGFYLQCFSGITGTGIYIDKLIFEVFKKTGYLECESYEEKCFCIADWLCEKLEVEKLNDHFPL